MQNDLIAVVSREELAHISTGGAAQRVKATIWVDINDDRHRGCVRHQRRRAVVVGVDPAQHGWKYGSPIAPGAVTSWTCRAHGGY